MFDRIQCLQCDESFNIRKYGEGACPKCGSVHFYQEGYIIHNSDAATTNPINSPEMFEEGCWYPVFIKQNGFDVLKYENGLFSNSDENRFYISVYFAWIGQKVHFPEKRPDELA